MSEIVAPRYLVDVLNEILKIIPEGENKAALEDNMSSAAFCAPEGMGLWWRESADSLADLFGDGIPKNDWQFQAASIFSGKTIEEIKALYP